MIGVHTILSLSRREGFFASFVVSVSVTIVSKRLSGTNPWLHLPALRVSLLWYLGRLKIL